MITNEKAKSIAQQFIAEANPTGWNGKGKRPASFSTQPITFRINSFAYLLKISYVFDKAERAWSHSCELFDPDMEMSLGEFHGCGINSAWDLANTIIDICLTCDCGLL